MTAAPYLLGRRGPGRAVIANDPGGGSGVTDGGFVDQPVVTTTASGNTTVKGKTKPGSFGKFVLPLATIAAGRQYTFRYTPHFAQLAQQGKLAMVGFGLKTDNDFHIVGLRGDGSTGLSKYKVNGTPPNGWNKDTGHTTSDGGASANGTQAGPNYIRLVVSADGATYTFQTSPDGVTWADEYTGQTPTPFSNVSAVTTFGLALWFNNADAGPFSIDIDQFADAAAPTAGPIVTYWGTIDSGTGNANDQTYTDAPIGPEDASRIVVVVAEMRRGSAATRSLLGVTFDGAAGTLHDQISVIGTNGLTIGLASKAIATGTTVTIVTDWAGLGSFAAISVYTITGLASPTIVDVRKASSTSTDPSIGNLITSANGVVIAGFVGCDASGAQLMTLSGVSEDYDDDTFSSDARFTQIALGHAGVGASAGYSVGMACGHTTKAMIAGSWA
ncbi:hypothetical protein [Mesorhizobium sp.]|uniref:hypothetical protein n=1 Tax=Mesorhizobium sp. TaxID=1871066 RepID=UPI000FE5E966|nr:hypothetical protein [Mesorhizobium sp.]RWC25926.1 MAG: hypothetical protein EOS27_27120 [Mesorhizobium sp.]TIX27290.1 MAG: hypothetical protein E5V35_06990 [Mesorhizobium sp.]